MKETALRKGIYEFPPANVEEDEGIFVANLRDEAYRERAKLEDAMVIRSISIHRNIRKELARKDPLDYTIGEKVEACMPGGYSSFPLGHYPQNTIAGRDKTPMTWIVLYADEEKALVTTRHAIDCTYFSRRFGQVTWENSEIREWLNGAFYQKAFSEDERKFILETVVETKVNQKRVPGAEVKPHEAEKKYIQTRDHIFLLSSDEVRKYYESKWIRLCRTTFYSQYKSNQIFSYWWLRDPGRGMDTVLCVDDDGEIDNHSYYADNCMVGIRPAMWMSFKETSKV